MEMQTIGISQDAVEIDRAEFEDAEKYSGNRRCVASYRDEDCEGIEYGGMFYFIADKRFLRAIVTAMPVLARWPDWFK